MASIYAVFHDRKGFDGAQRRDIVTELPTALVRRLIRDGGAPRRLTAITVLSGRDGCAPAVRPGTVRHMGIDHSDALVFFGATGDLAYKQIFPALTEAYGGWFEAE
jgi:hypothetical protein